MPQFLTPICKRICLTSAILTALIIVALVCGCSSSKTITKQDSSKVVELSNIHEKSIVYAAVTDTLRIVLPKLKTGDARCDSLAQLYLDNQAALHTTRHGEKSYLDITYQPKDGSLTAIAHIKETSDTIDSEKVEKSAVISKNEECQCHYPLWIKVLALIGILFLVFIGWRISRIFL